MERAVKPWGRPGEGEILRRNTPCQDLNLHHDHFVSEQCGRWGRFRI